MTTPGTASHLIAFVERRPVAAFAILAALHGAVWTLLPTLLYPNLPLDLIEALTYGREWQLGYDKLPPLPWWSVEIVRNLVGVDAGYYLLAQIAVLAALALVFATARRAVGGLGALAAVAIVDGLHYFGFTAAKFNHDVVQLPFWALAGYAFHGALRQGRMRDWILLGIALGAAAWAKYFVVVLAAPLALFILLDPRARPALRTPGPYVAAAVALLVFLPHLVWLIANDFLPFAYAEARSAPVRGLLDHAIRPLVFAGGQLGWLVPSLLIALPLFLPRPAERRPEPDGFDRRIVTLLAFGPAALLVAGSAITGRGLITMWGYPLWLFLGLWLVMMAKSILTPPRLGRLALTWAVVSGLYAIAFVVQYAVLPHFDHRYRASLFPGAAMAQHVSEGFRRETGRPLAYVIAGMWLGGNVSAYTPERPRTLIDGKPARAPWIDLGDLSRRGAVVVWTDGDRNALPAAYAAIAADARVQPPFTLPMRWGHGEITVGWAIVAPRAR
jgi:4-amino-4-deoxy-L-arabinose transferase-like glycosyltransferase